MDKKKIQSALEASSEEILSASSFSGKLEKVYEILDKAFPKISEVDAVCGPITNMGVYQSRKEIETVLQALKESIKNKQIYLTTDKATNDALEIIYDFVE